MLLLNEKETKIILNAMEFLETLGTPEATKQAELIDSVTYSQVNDDADVIDLLLGCFNELENKYSRYELIENECYNLLDEIRKEAQQEIKNDTGYHNVKLDALKKESENIENIIYRDSIDYHNELSEIEYYNCNDELGSYLKYYIESDII